MHRTRSDRVASKPIEHIRGTHHNVKQSETHIWIEFRVKQPTLTPGKVHNTRALEIHRQTNACS